MGDSVGMVPANPLLAAGFDFWVGVEVEVGGGADASELVAVGLIEKDCQANSCVYPRKPTEFGDEGWRELAAGIVDTAVSVAIGNGRVELGRLGLGWRQVNAGDQTQGGAGWRRFELPIGEGDGGGKAVGGGGESQILQRAANAEMGFP